MLPVPSHLPRKAPAGGEQPQASGSRPRSGSGSSSPPSRDAEPGTQVVDTVLDLFEPLFAAKQLESETVRGVRQALERAISENKDITHQLLKSNYPSISSHIRAGAQIKADFTSVQAQLQDLEARIDPANPETSFIPPVLALLQRHFTAVRSQSRSQAHVRALKQLKAQVGRLDRLEEAVYGARSADDEVVQQICDPATADAGEGQGQGQEGDGALAKSTVFKTLCSRRDLLKSMAIDQTVDGFKQAISFDQGTASGSSTLTVRHRVSLQKPRNPRPGDASTSSPTGEAPSYTLSQIYSALSRTGSLAGPLRQLQTELVDGLVTPLLGGNSALAQEKNDASSSLRLSPSSTSERRSATEVLQDLSTLFDFIANTVFPEDPSISQARINLLAELHATTSRLLLSDLILPALPSERSSIITWLETIRAGVNFEAQTRRQTTAGQGPSSQSSIEAFLDASAGSAWANARRRHAAEQTRNLVVGGWQGWEATEISRDKEISVVVEVEIEEEEADEPMPSGHTPPEITTSNITAGDGGDRALKTEDTAGDEEEGGWGFDEDPSSAKPAEQSTSTSTSTSSQSPKQNGASHGTEEVDDGWAFDDDLSTPAPAPAPVVAPKPTREAKKLGRRVAKTKVPGSDDDDMTASASDMSRTNSIQRPATPPPPPPPAPATVAEPMDWEAWDDETPAKKPEPKAKRKELREQKRTIKETFLVSKACDSLLQYAEDVLRDAQQIEASLPAPSFSSAPPILHHTATEVFDLYRALITTHFAAQLQSVPTLSMQVYNDSIHLSDRLEAISSAHLAWAVSSTETQRRLRESGEAVFERELERQRDSLVTTLDGIDWSRGVEGLKRSLAVPRQVKNDLEDLSRMFHTVLPTTTFLSVMGYLVNVAITYITDAILSQQDITEDESIQLTELLRVLHPLEELFILEPGQPSSVVTHVHGWLKFCYLLELLSANLVDITYLFENGALIDFTPDELISLLKALFADSEKREKAIERIEQGL